MKKKLLFVISTALLITFSFLLLGTNEASAASSTENFKKEIVRLTNIERDKVGVQPVISDSDISYVATLKAEDMRENNYFSHYSAKYGDAFYMMYSFGIPFDYAGENIAARQSTPAQVVNSWMKSDSHREVMLDPGFKKVGVGYANGGILDHYWVQMFTN